MNIIVKLEFVVIYDKILECYFNLRSCLYINLRTSQLWYKYNAYFWIELSQTLLEWLQSMTKCKRIN